MSQTTGQAAPRRIPTTQKDLDLIITIAKHSRPGGSVVKLAGLVPTGALITLFQEENAAAVTRLLNASGYTAHEVGGNTIAVTGVISRLEILRAERERLDAEIAAEEERQGTATAAA